MFKADVKWFKAGKRTYRIGGEWRRRKIFDIQKLSNGWIILKTENTKSPNDFKVRTITSTDPIRSYTPKHAHFAIDFYGKICANREKALKVFRAIIDIWHGREVSGTLKEFQDSCTNLPGYPLEYILFTLRWILEQEDVNFTGRSPRKQKELDHICSKQDVFTPERRKGSQLALSVFCNIINGAHPVEAFIKAGLKI